MVDDGRQGRATGPGYLVTGRYRLLRKIGSGAMGAVWLARDELLGREVAVKQVLTTAAPGSEEAEDQRRRSLREGRIAARLTHPHAIAMYDVALDGGDPWLVMEHLPSSSLAAVVQSRAVLPYRQVAQIGAQVADALAAAHAAGIVHRDVKPGNILVGEGGSNEGVVKITDFGISRAQGDVTVTKTGIISGTPAYFAPEVARGQDPTAASDVFALGATLFASVEGVPPFGLDDNAIALLHRVARGEVQAPTRAGEMTPVLLHMLEPDPSRRPTMVQVRDELAAVAAGRRGAVADVLAARTSVLPVGRGAAVVGGAALGGLAAGAAAGTARGATPDPTLVGVPAGPPTTYSSAPRGDVGGGPPSRGGGLLTKPVLAAAAVVFLLTALAAYLLTTGDEQDANAQGAAVTTTAPPSTTAAAAPPSTTEAPASPATTTTPVPTTTPEPTPAAPTADDVEAALAEFFGLLPGDPEAAFALAGPSLQAQGLESFDAFWSGYDRVTLDSVEAREDATAAIVLTFTNPDGSTQTELHEVTLLQTSDGRLLLDTDDFVEVLAQGPAGPGNGGRNGNGNGNGGDGGSGDDDEGDG